MSIEELLNLEILGKNVFILGFPASGKSFLANELYHNSGRTHQLVRTDDFLGYGYEQSLYELIEFLDGASGSGIIVEGVGVYRLLRKVDELNLTHLKPDVIIECSMPEGRRDELYRRERPDKDLKAVKRFNLGLQSVYNGWAQSNPEKASEVLIFNNPY